ncbi:MAG: hypothetical protein Q7J06_10035 [Bacteroidales bacterium]|nr:hypothetical protein [Bacteroidales bacterium]
MNKSLKSALKDWLPPVVYVSLIRLVTELRFLSYTRKDILQKNRLLKGMGKGKRAFLLATGPSIKQENLKLLAGEDCFSISNFFLHDDIKVINPVFHGLGFYHEPLILENYVEWLRLADRTLPPRTKIILGHTAYDIVQNYGLFPDREVCYIYFASSRRRCVNLLRPVLCALTGPLLMLPLIIYMGYEQIYLLGCDNTTIRDYKKTFTNFYNPDQDMRKNATDKNMWIDIETEFWANTIIFEQYRFYQDILKFTSTRITNLSVDSWLEMFPFDRLENIIQK